MTLNAQQSEAVFSTAAIDNFRALIDFGADAHGNSPFLVDPEDATIISFHQLRTDVQSLCAQLFGAGLERGDKVAFLLDNGVFAAELSLGSMYGGFVMVPLNARAGVTQLTYVLDHCDAKVVFTDDEHRGLLDEALAQVGRPIRILPARIDWTGPAPALPQPSPDEAALLMYTSGSTGTPKAAIHTQRSLLASSRNMQKAYSLTSEDRSLLVLPLYHINGQAVTLIPTLLSGGSVVTPKRFDVSRYWDLLDEYRCTWSAIVPTIVSQLLDWQDPKAGQREQMFSRLRFIRSSSAPLAPSLQLEFLKKFPVLLIQAMGSSEAGNVFSNPLPPGENKVGTPGPPAGFEGKIVGRDGAELPNGECGEVLIRGAGMMQGYYKSPEETATVLDKDGWFHTGDLAYRDEVGYFFVVGRSKELIIKGGMNIAPRQIDDVLESHPAVLEAAALGIPDAYMGEDVIACVVLRTGRSVDERELLSFCESRLGHFRTPTRIHLVSDLPKGPSGKVQRLRIKVQMGELLAAGATVTPDRVAALESLSAKAIETIVAACWRDVLALPQIDLEANFFSSGGHSLAAIQCVSRLREKIPVALSLTDFFENPTIKRQVELISQRLSLADGTPAVAASRPGARIPRRDVSAPGPLSPAQLRIWFDQQLQPGSLQFNEAEANRLIGPLNVGALESSIATVVGRHEILRTIIKEAGGQPVAVVLGEWAPKVKRIDLSGLPQAEREDKVQGLLVDEPRRLYHLTAEPGLRVTLLTLAPEDHILILMVHHLFFDWASTGILWREMAACYKSQVTGEPDPFPAPVIQHSDYAAWRAQEAARSDYAAELAYWEKELSGLTGALPLPADHPRPAVQSHRGKKLWSKLDRSLTLAAREMAQASDATLFIVLASALSALLYRYTGEGDIPLGIPIGERDRPELEGLIGFLLQVHALRARVSGDLSFGELVSQLRRSTLDLYQHRAAPFDLVVNRLHPKRSASYTPVYQTMFIWRESDQMPSFIGLEGLKVEPVLAESQSAKFDLTFCLTDCGNEIGVEVEYSADLFDEDRIVRMIEHYRTLLSSLVSQPSLKLSQARLLPEPEQRQLLAANPAPGGESGPSTVHGMFAAQVARKPSAIAVQSGDARLTYSELDRKSSALAVHLESLGVQEGSLVVVCLDRSVELAVALLAVLKAGGAYLPLDLSFPAERLAYMLEDAAPRVLVTHSTVLEKLPPYAGTTICIDRTNLPAGTPHGEHSEIAYVLYTSGSTGKPKGVEVSHRALVNFLHSMREVPGLTESDILLSVTTYSFDIFGLELWLPLTTGAKVVIASTEESKDAARLSTVIRESRATVMQATPATWRLLLDSGWEGSTSLKILCGGEAWSRELAERLLRRCASLWNMYGPTETTIWSAVRQIRSGDEVTIGPPIANTTFYVVDSHMNLQPHGVPGELLIGGDGLARGYLNRPELTQEKFIPNPCEPGTIVYRTGDLVQRLPDGGFRFLARLDQQVKLRGFRIELGEIESVLRTHPKVREAAVAYQEGIPGKADARLVAYIASLNGPGDVPETDALRQYARTKLPDYMVPSEFLYLDALPVTPNGKLNRKALPLPVPGTRHDHAATTVAGDGLEACLTNIWEDVLRVRPVRPTDDFFELGGHSFAAVRLVGEIEKRVGKRLPLATLFQAPTVEAVAKILREKTTPSWSSLVPIHGEGSKRPLFLVHGAEGNVLLYRQLADHFRSERPVFGLQSRGLNGEETGLSTIPELASHYLRELLSIDENGPFALGGYCMGGLVALEMAQQLEAMGKPVQVVFLLETYNVNSVRRDRVRRNTIVRALQNVYFHAANLAALPSGKRRGFLKEKLDVARTRTHIRWDAFRHGDHSSGPYRRLAVKRINDVAALHYQPRPYGGKVVLLRPKAFFNGFSDPSFGWDKAGMENLEIHRLPIFPRGMLIEPFCASVADTIKRCLAQSEQRPPGAEILHAEKRN